MYDVLTSQEIFTHIYICIKYMWLFKKQLKIILQAYLLCQELKCLLVHPEQLWSELSLVLYSIPLRYHIIC